MDDFAAGVGPLFGPDFVEVVVNDETGRQFTLQVYPDAHNGALKAAGLPQQYYFQPQRVVIAKKQDHPADYDFGMTVFKGLGTGETTLGVTATQSSDGSVETGGGFCSFTTTFGIPDSVLANAIGKLKAADHPAPPPRLGNLFGFTPGDPEPRLGVVPITDNAVTIAVPDLVAASAGTRAPMFLSAQTTGKGSIESHGFSSFLITCNQLAAGAIAGSIENGISPFVVTNRLKESFYVNGITATVHVDVDKVYDSFSLAVSTGGFLGIDSFSANYAYSNCLTSGGITTQIDENGAVLDPKLKDWVEQKVEEMRKAAMDLVKAEIFDWDPTRTDASQATADRGWFSSIFGGSSVGLKSNYQKRSIKLDTTIVLNETISVDHAVSGDLSDLMDAVRADRSKYLAIVDIGKWFQKVQVAATCAVNWKEKLPDGTELHDPLVSVQLQAGYPDFNAPRDAAGNPNLRILGEGFHYTLASRDPNAGVQPVIWTEDNPKDIINLSWLRLDEDLPGWPRDQVMLRRRLVFDGQDPRVNLSSAGGAGDGVVVEFVEPASLDHAPVLTPAQVGYIFARFVVNRKLPKSNISVVITPTIGGDTYPPIQVTSANLNNAIWEVYSDKYFDVDSLSYTVDVTVTGPNFTDDPVMYSSPAPVKVPIPAGRIKYLNPLPVALPAPPADQVAVINGYVANTAE